MIKKLFLLILFVSLSQVKGQDEATNIYGILPTDVPTHNLVKYNRFYFNPTFSFVRENKKSVNAYNKIQWAGFNDNPQTFLVNYTGTFGEKIGAGVGLYQQNEGVYRYFGGVANFAYNAQFDDEMNLTFGLNLGYSHSGLRPNIDAADNTQLNNGVTVINPIIANYESSSVFQISPGINFNYTAFDVGVSASNLVAYNLNGSALLTNNMALTGHVMYTTSLDGRSDEKIIRAMGYANMLPGLESESESSLRYGGNVIVELPELGWAQAGYNSFYGASLGIGGNITPNVSVGYTYEMGLGDTGTFGSTHEVGLAYNFEKEKPRRSSSSTEKAYQARDSEIRRLKNEILELNKLLREQQEKGGDQSDAQRAMSELERSIAEAKEKEARAISDTELKREENVKLLNAKEDLAAQRELEREIAEQKEEERLASQRTLEREVNQEETEEAAIAAEEAARAEEAAKQQAEEDQEAEQQQRRIQELTRSTKEIIASGDVDALRSQMELLQSNTLIAQSELQSLVSEINTAVEEKEEEQRLRAQKQLEQEVALQKIEDDKREVEALTEKTREVIAAGNLQGLRSQLQLVQSSSILPVAEKQNLINELNAAIQAKESAAAEAARQAEEQRRIQELTRATQEIIASGDLNALRSQMDIVRASNILPQAQKQNLRSELEKAIQVKEAAAAEAQRLAEEERKRQEAAAAAEAARLAEEERIRQEAAAAKNDPVIAKKVEKRLLNTSLDVDKRGFNKLLESLVNMGDDAKEAKNSTSSSKQLTATNRFVKFADATRPEAQYATKSIPGYQEGFYLIGNVFKDNAYSEKFSGTLRDLGFNNSQIIINPDNNFQYVAIEYYRDKEEAARKYLSNIDNRYYGDMWILNIVSSGNRVASFKQIEQETRTIRDDGGARNDEIKDNPIITESLSYIGGHNIKNGYYLISNIFKRENYFERGMARLKEQGLDPQYFRNPKDNYIYVYLKRFDSLSEAKESMLSNVNGTYSGDLYILKIQ